MRKYKTNLDWMIPRIYLANGLHLDLHGGVFGDQRNKRQGIAKQLNASISSYQYAFGKSAVINTNLFS